MIDLLRFVFGLAADLVRRRVELVAENALLRQQLIVAKRKLAARRRVPEDREGTRPTARWRQGDVTGRAAIAGSPAHHDSPAFAALAE